MHLGVNVYLEGSYLLMWKSGKNASLIARRHRKHLKPLESEIRFYQIVSTEIVFHHNELKYCFVSKTKCMAGNTYLFVIGHEPDHVMLGN